MAEKSLLDLPWNTKINPGPGRPGFLEGLGRQSQISRGQGGLVLLQGF